MKMPANGPSSRRPSYNLHLSEQGKPLQQFGFPNANARQMFLIAMRNAARHKKQQYQYRRGEYLRIYRNAELFQVWDIKPPASTARQQAENQWKELKNDNA